MLIDGRRFYAALFSVFTFAVIAASCVAIVAQQGLYATLLWLPLPIGALGYIKARCCPLQVRPGPPDNAGRH